MLNKTLNFIVGAAVVALFSLVFNMALFGITFSELFGGIQ